MQTTKHSIDIKKGTMIKTASTIRMHHNRRWTATKNWIMTNSKHRDNQLSKDKNQKKACSNMAVPKIEYDKTMAREEKRYMTNTGKKKKKTPDLGDCENSMADVRRQSRVAPSSLAPFSCASADEQRIFPHVTL